MTSDFRASKRFNGFVDGLQSKGIKLIDQENYSSGSTVEKGKDFHSTEMLKRNHRLWIAYTVQPM